MWIEIWGLKMFPSVSERKECAYLFSFSIFFLSLPLYGQGGTRPCSWKKNFRYLSLSLLQTRYIRSKVLFLSVNEEYLVGESCLHVVVQPADEVGNLK